MPQLDTSTWFITITSMIMTLFILFQLKSQTTHTQQAQNQPNSKLKNMAPLEKQNERKSICLFHCPYDN
uniref:ATP synthase complex subunit 8 n=1 Tax=Sus scrofa domesticus TaxID=9825 RepID=W8EMY0_PIG|nr:ATP synthase F0 subunit 8 [Sus scrofa domesticus]QGX04465.1 ATP synthase F0 subunit 8 [Sus scrofa]